MYGYPPAMYMMPQQQPNSPSDEIERAEKWLKFIKEQTKENEKKDDKKDKEKKTSEKVLSFMQAFAITCALSVPVGMFTSYFVVLIGKTWAEAMLNMLK